MGIDEFAQEINKSEKKELIRKGTELVNLPRFSSGSLSLDAELGTNDAGEAGFPVGKIISVTGEMSAGKSVIVTKGAAGFYKRFPNQGILWLDAEGAFDPNWVRALGLDPEVVHVMAPEYSEQAFNAILKAVEHNVGLIVLDSLGALSPKDEMEADMETFTVGLQARLNRKMMRRFQNGVNDTAFEVPTTLMYINHLSQKVGGGGGRPGNVPLIEYGGEALKYFPSVKILVRKGDHFPKSVSVADEGVEPKAQEMKFFIPKNKTAPPLRRGHFWFYFDTLDEYRTKGCYDTLEELIRYALKYDLIGQRASMYDLIDPETGEVLETFKGSAKLAKHLRENTDIYKKIEQGVLQRVRGDMVDNGAPLSTDEELQKEGKHEAEGTESS